MYNILKNNDDFNKIINEGYKLVSRSFFLYYIPSDFFQSKDTKLGISVGKKLGKAHLRNHQKRIMRNIFQHNEELLRKKTVHCVVIIRPLALKLKYSDVEKDFIKTFKEINEKQ